VYADVVAAGHSRAADIWAHLVALVLAALLPQLPGMQHQHPAVRICCLFVGF
jgi:hypothetical protein